MMRTGKSSPEIDKGMERLGINTQRGRRSDEMRSVTHIVTSQARRTVKFLCGLAHAHTIVTEGWPASCATRKSLFVDPKNHFPKGTEALAFEKKWGFKLKKSLSRAREKKLFAGKTLFLSKSFSPGHSKAYKAMWTEHGGGEVLTRAPRKFKENVVIVMDAEKDRSNIPKFTKKGFDVFNKELIVVGILRQEDLTA